MCYFSSQVARSRRRAGIGRDAAIYDARLDDARRECRQRRESNVNLRWLAFGFRIAHAQLLTRLLNTVATRCKKKLRNSQRQCFALRRIRHSKNEFDLYDYFGSITAVVEREANHGTKKRAFGSVTCSFKSCR